MKDNEQLHVADPPAEIADGTHVAVVNEPKQPSDAKHARQQVSQRANGSVDPERTWRYALLHDFIAT